ncbi:hypothetical protein FOZ61_000072 [Perkinsus olseni]|uniref:Uncharacterized protein n=1 Tax=Perkinsus olseni TaxID=32597 RepID=A0A7J6MJT5_PEROL|nr:hypothetical protein FOZ61_000072 [Perkinsus olseni]
MPQPPLPRGKKGGDGDFWTKLNRRRQFTDESAEVWETRGTSSHADAVYESGDGLALQTPTKVVDRIARFSSVSRDGKSEVILSSSRTSRLTVAVSARVSPTALAELHESGSTEGKQLNIRRSITFPHGHQTHIEGCSTTASTSSSPSAHTSRIRHLYNSNDVEMCIEQLAPSATSAMSEVVHDADPVSTSTPSITPVTPDQPGEIRLSPLQASLSLPLGLPAATAVSESPSVAPSVTRFRMSSSISVASDESCDLSLPVPHKARLPSPTCNQTTPSSSSKDAKEPTGEDNEALQGEIQRLRLELEQSRQRVRDLEDSHKSFWEEDVFDIINKVSIQRVDTTKDGDSNLHSVSIKSLLPTDCESSVRNARRGTSVSSCSSTCSFHTAISSFHWSDDECDSPTVL